MRKKGKCSKCGEQCEWYLCKSCLRIKNSEYHKSNKERIHGRKRENHLINQKNDNYREKRSRFASEWYARNRLHVLKRNKELLDKKRKQILEHYGNRCVCCGENEAKFLTLDHKNNDGAEHRREIGYNRTHIISWILKNNYPDRIQLLCYNCNCAKGVYGKCPHQNP